MIVKYMTVDSIDWCSELCLRARVFVDMYVACRFVAIGPSKNCRRQQLLGLQV